MTIESILGYSADDLEKMTDDELLSCLGPYLDSNRPLPGKEQKEIKNKTIRLKKDKDVSKAAQELLKQIQTQMQIKI